MCVSERCVCEGVSGRCVYDVRCGCDGFVCEVCMRGVCVSEFFYVRCMCVCVCEGFLCEVCVCV